MEMVSKGQSCIESFMALPWMESLTYEMLNRADMPMNLSHSDSFGLREGKVVVMILFLRRVNIVPGK